MTLWNLDTKATDQLVAMPESGMGFQWVTAKAFGSPKQFLILNSSVAVDVSDMDLQVGGDPATVLANGLKIIDAQRREGPTKTIFSAPSLSYHENLQAMHGGTLQAK